MPLPSEMLQRNRESVEAHLTELLRQVSADDFFGSGAVSFTIKGGRVQDVEITTNRKKKSCDQSPSV